MDRETAEAIKWLRTAEAAYALGCSQNHLKECRDSRGSFLIAGKHHIPGLMHTSPVKWNITAVQEAFHRRSMQRVAANVGT